MSTRLEASIVRIFASDQVVGTGFLVEEATVLTCAHVVAAAVGISATTPTPPETPVHLDFPLVAPGHRLAAHVIFWQAIQANSGGDIAVLHLEDTLPHGTTTARLVLADELWNHSFRAFGFPRDYDQGVWASGKLRASEATGWVQIEDIKVTGKQVQRGFSGGAVWDEQLEGVVGMVVAADEDASKVAYMIPAPILIQAFPDLKNMLHPPTAPLGKLNNIPGLPPHFLPRLSDLGAVKKMLLADMNPAAVTGISPKIGLHGMAGIGKSVLATALAQDEDIRRAFPDGIFWITLGQKPTLTVRQSQLAEALDASPRVFQDEQQGRARLSELLSEKACLIILDDAWLYKDAEAFLALGSHCRMLITTRDTGLITGLGATEYRLKELSDEQALELLSEWVGQARWMLPIQASIVVQKCENLPLALALSGAQIRDGTPWADLLEALREADLEFLDHAHGSIMKALKVSIDALPEDQSQLYLELAVFPEDAPVPEAAVLTLWLRTKGRNERHARQLITAFANKALLRTTGESPKRSIELHDLQYIYLRRAMTHQDRLHLALLEEYRKKCSNGWPTVPNDGYIFDHLAYHLVSAGRKEELGNLLLDFNWLYTKLAETDTNALMKDYDFLLGDSDLRLVQGAIRLGAHILTQDKTQLASQLLGRLLSCEISRVQHLLEQTKGWQATPWLRPLLASLTPPGGSLLSTLVGHTMSVTAVKVMRDGQQALSASLDNTLKLWDLGRGTELCTLRGHTDATVAIVVMRDGKRAISASWDNTLRMWDLERGAEIYILQGHTDSVAAVAITPDEQHAISASADHTLKVWDLERRVELCTLVGHNDGVTAVAITPDGKRAISASADHMLKIWDLERRVELCTLVGHTDSVTTVAVLPDGKRAISASADHTLKVWDLERRVELCTLVGHNDGVTAVAVLPDGKRAISASADHTIKIWNLQHGTELYTLQGHSHEVTSVALTPDGKRAVTGSGDHTLRIWDLERKAELLPLQGLNPEVTSIAVTLDGKQVVSASGDHTLKVWDMECHAVLSILRGHTGTISMVVLTPDGKRAVTASGDHSLKVWNLEQSTELYTLQGHSREVTSVALTSDGQYVVSASSDGTLKVWSLERGTEIRTFRGHTGAVNAIAMMPNGRHVVSVSSDHTLKVWDLEHGIQIAAFHGESPLQVCAVAPDGLTILAGEQLSQFHILRLEGN